MASSERDDGASIVGSTQPRNTRLPHRLPAPVLFAIPHPTFPVHISLLGKINALNSAPISTTIETRYSHTSSAITAASDP